MRIVKGPKLHKTPQTQKNEAVHQLQKNFITNEQLDRVSAKCRESQNNFSLGLTPRLPAGQALNQSAPSTEGPQTHTLPHPWCYLRLHLVSSPWKTDGSHLQQLPAISLCSIPVCASPDPQNEQSLVAILNLWLNHIVMDRYYKQHISATLKAGVLVLRTLFSSDSYSSSQVMLVLFWESSAQSEMLRKSFDF